MARHACTRSLKRMLGNRNWPQHSLYVAIKMGLDDVPTEIRQQYAELKGMGPATNELHMALAEHLTACALQHIDPKEKPPQPHHRAACHPFPGDPEYTGPKTGPNKQ